MSIQNLSEADDTPNPDAQDSIITISVLNGLNIPASPSEANKTSSSSSYSSDVAILTQMDKLAHLPTTAPAAIAAGVKICGVCKEKEYKYKCSRCLLPYCSIACSTLHKATHPALPSPSPAATPQPKPTPAISARAGTLSAAHAASPFASLAHSPELHALFKHYPLLSVHLNAIYSAMQPPQEPTSDMYEKLTGKHNNKRAWNQDRGLEKGREALGRAREEWGKDGEGVREFGELVLRIVQGEGEGAVRREVDWENEGIVRRLLEGEV